MKPFKWLSCSSFYIIMDYSELIFVGEDGSATCRRHWNCRTLTAPRPSIEVNKVFFTWNQLEVHDKPSCICYSLISHVCCTCFYTIVRPTVQTNFISCLVIIFIILYTKHYFHIFSHLPTLYTDFLVPVLLWIINQYLSGC